MGDYSVICFPSFLEWPAWILKLPVLIQMGTRLQLRNLEKEVGDYTQYIKRLLKVILNIANNLHKINAKMK